MANSEVDPNSPAVLIASKFEVKFPQVDWPSTYHLARKFGLSPEQKTFLFKMKQSLLPNRERLTRVGKIQSAACTFCLHPEDDTAHLFSCTQGAEITTPLLRCLSDHAGMITPQNVAMLNLTTAESMELPVVWLVSTCMMMVWEDRVAGRTARLVNCQAELEARLLILKHTRWKYYTLHNSALLLEETMNLHFV